MGLLAFVFPGSDVDGGEAGVFRPAVLASMLDNLVPGVLDRLLFLPQLPQDVSKIYQRFAIFRLQLQ